MGISSKGFFTFITFGFLFLEFLNLLPFPFVITFPGLTFVSHVKSLINAPINGNGKDVFFYNHVSWSFHFFYEPGNYFLSALLLTVQALPVCLGLLRLFLRLAITCFLNLCVQPLLSSLPINYLALINNGFPGAHISGFLESSSSKVFPVSCIWPLFYHSLASSFQQSLTISSSISFVNTCLRFLSMDTFFICLFISCIFFSPPVLYLSSF